MLSLQWEQRLPPEERKGMEMGADGSRGFLDTGDIDLRAEFLDVSFIIIF